MIITTHLYNNITDEEVEATLTIHYTEFRKGNSVGSWHGATPDEEAEIILEEVDIDGKMISFNNPWFDIADDEDKLWDLVNEQLEGYEAEKADHEYNMRMEK